MREIRSAGLKGNQLGWLLDSIVSVYISDDELLEYINKYPDWNLGTKEEVYYFKFFMKFGYTKAKFDQKRTIVNKSSSLKGK